MAEGGAASQTRTKRIPEWSKKVQCRYFLHGCCRAGSNCPYAHSYDAPPSNICRFYQKGLCTYGDQCRYDHVKPNTSSKLPSTKSILTRSSKPPPIMSLGEDTAGKMVSLKKKGDKEEIREPELPKSPDEWVKATEFVPGQPYVCSTTHLVMTRWTYQITMRPYPVSRLAGKHYDDDYDYDVISAVEEFLDMESFCASWVTHRQKCVYLQVPASYAKAAGTGGGDSLPIEPEIDKNCSNLLCPYLPQGVCPYEDECEYIHGDICELCGLPVLHPHNMEQQEIHIKECTDQHEKDMELSFAVSRSKDKACGICMDVIVDKQPLSERRFGILSDCNHIFCLSCIRKWRSAKQFENKIVRACPECRVKSDFVTPSQYWVESKEEKQELIESYKKALSGKACRYFDQGKGECPFNEKCFYLHAYPDGTKAEPKPRQRRRRQNAEGELDIVNRVNLWDFLEERQNRILLLEIDDLVFNLLFADSDSDSDFDDIW